MDRSDDDVQPCQQVLLLVRRPVGQDVHLDTGQDPERLRQHAVRGEPGEPLVERGHQVQLLAQAVGGQPAGDREPGRVVGEHHVLVTQLDRRERHLFDRGAAVGPVGVGMAVPAQGRPERRGRLVEVAPFGGAQAAQVHRLLTAQRLDHATGGHVAHTGELGQRAGGGTLGDLLGADRVERRRGGAKRPYPVGGLVSALQQERDAAQVGDRVAGCHAPDGSGAPEVSRSAPTGRRRG